MNQDFFLQLFNSNVIKFGEFTLKSGIKSPFYLDLRELISNPSLIICICDYVINNLISKIDFDVICGVPYTAIPYASYISFKTNNPMLMLRKEIKSYGTKKLIEGKIVPNQKVLIIEDIISSGASILETVNVLLKNGLLVKDVVVLIDRDQGGLDNLKKLNINVHSYLKISDIFNNLKKKINLDNKIDESIEWLKLNKFTLNEITINKYLNLKNNEIIEKPKKLSFTERSKICTNQISKRIFELMDIKKTNLCVSIDENKSEKILEIVKKIACHVIMIKLHCDIIDDFDEIFVEKLTELAKTHKFFIFEDRKFSDIGNTVKHQYKNGLYQIERWADIVNCFLFSGESIIQSLKESTKKNHKACLIVSQLSSKGNVITDFYTKFCIETAKKNQDFVIGFICQEKICDDPQFLYLMPGINLNEQGDNLDQSYTTPYISIKDKNIDIVIVGRGITKSLNIEESCEIYREKAYNSYYS